MKTETLRCCEHFEDYIKRQEIEEGGDQDTAQGDAL
jgi:hypothetical protein